MPKYKFKCLDTTLRDKLFEELWVATCFNVEELACAEFNGADDDGEVEKCPAIEVKGWPEEDCVKPGLLSYVASCRETDVLEKLIVIDPYLATKFRVLKVP